MAASLRISRKRTKTIIRSKPLELELLKQAENDGLCSSDTTALRNRISDTSFNNSEKVIEEKYEMGQDARTTTTNVSSPMSAGNQKCNPNRVQSVRDSTEAVKVAVDQIAAAFENTKRLEKFMDSFTQASTELAAKVIGKLIQEKCKDLVKIERLADSHSLRTIDQKKAFAEEIRMMLERWNLGFSVPGHKGVFRLFASPSPAGNPLGSFLLHEAGPHGGQRIWSWTTIAETLSNGNLVGCPSVESDRNRTSRSI